MGRKILLGAAILLACASVSHARITDKWCVGPNDDLCLDSNLRLQVAGDVVSGSSVTAAFLVGDGSALTGITATDDTKVLKAGDTMTGQLNLTGPNGNVVSQASVTASAFFGDGSQLTGINGAVVAASSRIAESQSVNATSFVQLSTVNVTLDGAGPVLILISLIVENQTNGDRIFDARLTLDGSQIGDTITTTIAKEGGGATADEVISFHFFANSLPAGSNEFVLEVKSDSTAATQIGRDVRLTVIEF